MLINYPLFFIFHAPHNIFPSFNFFFKNLDSFSNDLFWLVHADGLDGELEVVLYLGKFNFITIFLISDSFSSGGAGP